MASLREIRRKIKSVKSTQQITKAMKMVAAARLRKAQMAMINARPFAQKMEEFAREAGNYIHDVEELPFFIRPTGQKRILVVVTSDKGLCGAYNTNLLREAQRYLLRHGVDKVRLCVIGKKGRDYFRRIRGVEVLTDYVNILANVRYSQAEIIVNDLLDAYASRQYTAVDVLYNEFKTVVQQRVVVKQLLPVLTPEKSKTPRWPEYLYDPDKATVLKAIWLRNLQAQMYRVLLEGAASELAARMSSMENATQNASDLLSSLTLTMNRTRQASITKEILEVVSGAEALK